MVATIQSGATKEKIQNILKRLNESINKKRQKKRQSILDETFGKVSVFSLKTPLEIQKELRDEWD
ncbi:MAG: hypothetical protein MRY57_00885 [Candidatus Pacebacteria bacterium]|nr:hypothetical protein [Candidatus Paceibacterota bacterium]